MELSVFVEMHSHVLTWSEWCVAQPELLESACVLAHPLNFLKNGIGGMTSRTSIQRGNNRTWFDPSGGELVQSSVGRQLPC